MVLRLFKLLKHIQEINLSPQETLTLMRRLETDSCCAEDSEVLIKIMRVHLAFVVDGGPPPPAQASTAPAKTPRTWQAAKAARRRPCRSPGMGIASGSGVRSILPGRTPGRRRTALAEREVGSTMNRPDSLTLSTHEGEAIMERLAVSAPTRADCAVLIQVVRVSFWLRWTVQEAKRSLKRLRTFLFGKALPAPTPSAAPTASTAPAVPEAPEMPRGAGASSSGPQVSPSAAEVGAPAAAGPTAAARFPTLRGGHRPGRGRLGVEAYPGAARAQCRHEE